MSQNNKKNLLDIYHRVIKGKVIVRYDTSAEVYYGNALSDKAGEKLTKWYLKNIGAGATFEKNFRLVEIAENERVWWVDIVDNEFEEKVADWIYDEEGNTLLCYPDPREFDKILLEIDRKHGWNEWHEPPHGTVAIDKDNLVIKLPKNIGDILHLKSQDQLDVLIDGKNIILKQCIHKGE
ncbi:MAG: hypothetical protein ACE5KE_06525 [Methanosarcinales archaeon]